MAWMILIAAVVGAWTMLYLLGVERKRRVAEIELRAALQRQASSPAR